MKYYIIINNLTSIDNNYVQVTLSQFEKKIIIGNDWRDNWHEIDFKAYDKLKNNFIFPIRFRSNIEIKEIMNFFKLEELAI